MATFKRSAILARLLINFDPEIQTSRILAAMCTDEIPLVSFTDRMELGKLRKSAEDLAFQKSRMIVKKVS